MTQAVIEVGENVHIILRRSFNEEVRRHFAGTITAVAEGQIRAEGYTFTFNPTTLEYKRLPELRTRIFGLLDSGYIINVLPKEVVIEQLKYIMSRALYLTDGSGFRLEINEFNATS